MNHLKKLELSRAQKVWIAIGIVVVMIIIHILGAQFFYSELGYHPVDTDEEYRNALSVSPFTARAFENGYTYEYDGKEITSVEELEQAM
ncbi:MAG: hypothetical protein E7474_04375 [Ruminococcaceae bacterium]|nr:hypothetical protein [Oscillospiraceae bacterium]